MATTLYFRSSSAGWANGGGDPLLAGGASGWDSLLLSTTRGSSATSQSTSTVAGPTSGIEVATSTAPKREWLSDPLNADVTISGSITWNLRAAESNMSANVAINGILEKIDGATGVITLIDQTARVTELAVTTETAVNFAETPAAGISCKRGDRLRVRIFGDDAGVMASAYTFQFWWDGPTAAASGDSYLTLTENLTFVSEPAGTTIYPTDTASTVSTASVDREAWTSRGSGVQTDVTNTVAGYTSPVRITDTAGGTVVDWFTRPLAAFTLGGAVRCNIRALQSATSTNAATKVEISVVAGDGTGPVVWGIGQTNAELATSEGAQSFLVSGGDVSVTAGQRLRIRLYIDDYGLAVMGSGGTVTSYYAGAAGATGDTFLTFTQTLTEFVSGTTFTQALAGGLSFVGAMTRVKIFGASLAGGLSFVGSLTKKPLKSLTGGLSFVGSSSKRTSRSLTGGLSFSGVLTASRLFGQALAGGLSFVGSMTKKPLKALTGGLSFTSVFSKLSAKGFTGSITPSGVAAKRTSKWFAGGVTPSGVLSRAALYVRSFAGGLSFSGALTSARGYARSFAGGLSFAGTLSRSVLYARSFAGGLSFSGALTSARLYFRSLVGGLSFSGVVTPLFIAGGTVFTKALTGGLSFVGSMTKVTSRSLAGGLSFSTALAKRIDKSVSGGLSFSGVVSTIKAFTKALTGGLSFSGAMTTSRGYSRVFAGALSFSGSLTKRTARALTGGLSFVGSMSKRVARSLSGGLSFSGALTNVRLYFRSFVGSITPTGSLSKRVSKSFAGSIAPVGSLVKLVSRSFAGGLSFIGTLSAGRLFVKALTGGLSFVGSLTGVKIFALFVGDALSGPRQYIRRFPHIYRGLRGRR